MWDLARIESDRTLVKEYGLKNLKELWEAETEIGKVRRHAREILSGAASGGLEEIRRSMTERLSRLGVTGKDATVDSMLDLNERALLDRRLQTVVFKRGLSNTIKQSRQLITHGFISMGGQRVTRPGFLVEAGTEGKIGYFKPIDITKKQVAKPPAHTEEHTAEPAPTDAAPKE